MKKFCLLLLTASFFYISSWAITDTVALANKPSCNSFDAIGPVISYKQIGKSSCLANLNFNATITDIDGVNTNPGTRPRVYYKRSFDGNIWNNNSSFTDGWKYVEATNTSSPFNFVLDYTLLNGGGGITAGQTLQYFVVAQDLVGMPNVSINTGTFASPPASVALTAAAFPIGGGINFYTIVNNIGTNISIGATGDFPTLTASGGLFNVINNVGLPGNTTVQIIDPLVTENNAYPLYQVQNTGCAGGTVTLLIKPSPGVSPTLTGSRPNEPIIRILSSNVTIDGSNNGTSSRDLTLTNTNTNSPNVIIFGSSGFQPINNCTLKNTICRNTVSITACVVVSDGAVGGSQGYFNNITIQNNSIERSQIGLICVAVPGAGNGSITVTGNDLNAGSPNQIVGIGIYTEGVDGAMVTNNNVGNFEPTVSSPRFGIHLNTGTTNSTVSGNTIANISCIPSAAALLYGINITPAVAASNNVVTGNTISNITSGAAATVHAINVALASGGITIQRNDISNIKNTNASGYGAYGIGLSSTTTNANITVANNFIYDIAGVGSSTIARNGYGMYLSSGGSGYRIYYNSVLLNTSQGSTAGVPSALMISGITAAAALDIRNNILANTQTAGSTNRFAIYSANSNTIFSAIDNNDYYNAAGNLGFIGSTRTTLTDIQTGFGGNTNSVNVLPAFVSSTNLHLTSANCYLDGSATPVFVTTDIDAATRDVSTPDIGADEFTATVSNTLAGIVATPVCSYKTVSPAGTLYTTATCALIARVAATGLDPVAGKINACVTLDATQQFFNGEPYVQRHYDLEPVSSNQTTTSATVTLYFTDAEFVQYNNNNPAWPKLPTVATGGNADFRRANLKITQFHGAASTTPSSPGNYPGIRVIIVPGAGNVFWDGFNWLVTFNISGFSGFYVHTNSFGAPLPITINYLNGRKQGSNHVLDWKVTCITTPRATMTLERSSDGRNYTGLYTITADAARCNQPFDYIDTDPLKGMNYYRLKIVDADGKLTYSSTVALLHAVKGFDIVSIAPNPVVTDQFKLNVTSAQSGNMEMMIFDMQGRLVNRQTLSLIAGYNSLPVDVSKLSAGTYSIYGIAGEDRSRTMRIVKQ